MMDQSVGVLVLSVMRRVAMVIVAISDSNATKTSIVPMMTMLFAYDDVLRGIFPKRETCD